MFRIVYLIQILKKFHDFLCFLSAICKMAHFISWSCRSVFLLCFNRFKCLMLKSLLYALL
jgi:hypothetical protein